MASTRILQQSFNGGEVTPEFFGRMDDVKRQNGVATMRNFIALPQGPAVQRPGTKFIRAAKYTNTKFRLIPFVYSVTQSFALEFGNGYIRFHTDGGTLLLEATAYDGATTYYPGDMVTSAGVTYVCIAQSIGNTPASSPSYWRAAAWSNATAYAVGDLVTYGGVTYYCYVANTNNQPDVSGSKWLAQPTGKEYEIFAPYLEEDLFSLRFIQSHDVLTIVHPDYIPRELRRYGPTLWKLEPISFVSTLAAPTGVTATATVGTGTTTYNYVVTSVAGDGKEESLASSEDDVTNDLLTTGNKNTVTWTGASGAARYNVYREDNGLFGYIGQTTDVSFVDENIAPDLSKTPPISYSPLSGAGDWPRAVTYWEQRRVFAGTDNSPQNVWMTRTGTESNLSYSIPSRDDDGISFRIASRENNSIQHVVPLGDLVIMTNSAEWRCATDGAVTPTSISVRPQSYNGCSDVTPLVVNNVMVYVEGRGGHVRELAYNWNSQGYVSGDLSIRSPHLFDNKQIVDAAYARAPFPVCWFTNDDGALLGLTYIPEQQVSAWHQHDTALGEFESVCAVPEGNEDAVYVAVKRTIDGGTVRYVERLQSRFFEAIEDAFFVDCGATYDGAATDTVTGLDHLEGCTVSVLADGSVQPQQEVVGGSITIPVEASLIHVGLQVTADLKTLPPAINMEAYGQGRYKNVNKVWLRVYRSSGIFVGPTENRLTEVKQRTDEAPGSPPELVSEEVSLPIAPSWGANGQVVIRHTDPLPLTVVSLVMEISLGG